MRQPLALVVTSSALAGCSLIYNPGNLPPAVIDAPSDAEIVLDADPKMLMIDGVEPAMIYEGQGDFGSPPAVVVLHGHHIIDNNTIVEIKPKNGTAQLALGTPVIAGNGNWIALPVTAHVDPSLRQGTSVALDVTVTETIPPALGGNTVTSPIPVTLTLVGLNELDDALMPEVNGKTINTTLLAERYSKVDLSKISPVSFIGDKRAILRSMSSITTQALTANGAPGAGSTGGASAVGGCAGGSPGASGGCSQISGMPGGTLGGPGGGGGFALDGMNGMGSGAGGGGTRTGDEWIVNYEVFGSHTRNQAGGGGGGGGVGAGAGGAGGGSIELTADGDVSVGIITADGGAGSGSLSGGGGGAGGLVMLRAGGSLTTTGTISVKGGGGGGGGGGAGSPGRIRWDVPNGTAPTVDNGTQPIGSRHRGPAFMLTTPIFRTPYATIPLSGTPNDRFNVYSIHAGETRAGQQGASFSPDGTATIMQTLQQGYTHLCITLEGGQQGSPEADKCIDVAFLP